MFLATLVLSVLLDAVTFLFDSCNVLAFVIWADDEDVPRDKWQACKWQDASSQCRCVFTATV